MRPTDLATLFLAGMVHLGVRGLLSGQSGPRPPAEGAVNIRIVSPLGFEAFQAAFILTNEETNQVVRRAFRYSRAESPGAFRIDGLPVGRYRIMVDTPMLRTGTDPIRISVNAGDQWLTLCFPFERPVDNVGTAPSVELIGVVKSESSLRVRPWVRLVGVYCSHSRETQADERGQFTFSDLEEGLYTVVITRSKMDPVTKLVPLTTGVNRLDLAVP